MAKLIKNINSKILNLEGKEMLDERGSPVLVNKIIGNIIAQSKSADPVRSLFLAQKIYIADKEITIEDADYEMIFEVLKNADLSNIVKGALLGIFKPSSEHLN